jgi:hypothetical protein
VYDTVRLQDVRDLFALRSNKQTTYETNALCVRTSHVTICHCSPCTASPNHATAAASYTQLLSLTPANVCLDTTNVCLKCTSVYLNGTNVCLYTTKTQDKYNLKLDGFVAVTP